MIALLLYTLAWVLYSVVEGVREAYYFDNFPRPTKFNIHIIFMIQRTIVLAVFCDVFHWVFALVYALMFPFFHDGAYYITRNILNKAVYQKGFWDEPSKSSTATFDFKLWERTVMLVSGIILIFVIIKLW